MRALWAIHFTTALLSGATAIDPATNDTISTTGNSSDGSGHDSFQDEIALITQRRQYDLAQFPMPTWVENISTYLSEQKSVGTWPDVDYTTGCSAQRANWPIQQHWNRVITFAAAWSGLNPAIPSNWTDNEDCLEGALKGLDYWFSNDFTASDCTANGGGKGSNCPCGTPGLWNTNWFDGIILIPQLCSTACLLLNDANLTDTQRAGCSRIPHRAYHVSNTSIPNVGYLTGANLINTMQNSLSLALYTSNGSILYDVFNRGFGGVQFADVTTEDGIHRDGSFLQHSGVLYSGNYGMDLINAFVQLEGEAIGTSYAANDSVRDAFATDMRGSEYMIFVQNDTGRELWDYNVLGRFVAFAASDNQANSDIQFNVTDLAKAVADFSGPYNINDTVRRLASNGTDKLEGNHAFWASDYMVHRRDSFVLGSKMISSRSRNTEQTNGANPYAYHMGQGTLFSYVSGHEYYDIMDAWDWNLIPGTTTLLNYPPLEVSIVDEIGNKSWVGVVSDGWVGTAVEDYLDPLDGNIAYKKMWFYLDDSVVITTTGVTIDTSIAGVNSSNVAITILDNRRAADGGVYVDGEEVQVSQSGTSANGSTLYYGGNGYLSYDNPFALTLAEGNRTGNWSAISTSTAGVSTVPIFSAYTTIPHETYSYAVFLATTPDVLAYEAQSPTSTPFESGGVFGVAGAERLSLVFWPRASTSISVSLDTIGWMNIGNMTVTSSQPATYLFATRDNGDGTQTMVVTLADPSQTLDSVTFSVSSGDMTLSCVQEGYDDGCQASKGGVSFTVMMSSGGLAGSSVFRDIRVS